LTGVVTNFISSDIKDTRPLPAPLRTAIQDPETHLEAGDKTTKTFTTDGETAQRAPTIAKQGKNKAAGEPNKSNDDSPNTKGLSQNKTSAGP
jgi:hypothetical protein